MVNTEEEILGRTHWELECAEDTSMFAIGNIGQKGKFRMSVEGIIDDNKQELIDMIYPVGSIYMSVNDINPANLFGGSWSKIEDKFLLASGSSFTATYDDSGVANKTGGSKDAVVVSHNHTQPAHSHSPGSGRNFLTVPSGSSWTELAGANVSGSGYHYLATSDSSNYNAYPQGSGNATPSISTVGESGTDKNMPPYLVVNIWRRTE